MKIYLSLILLFLINSSLYSQVNFWNGSVSADWHNPANWDLEVVPDATSSININNGSATTPVVMDAVMVGNIVMEGSGLLIINSTGNLKVNGNANNSILIRDSGKITNHGILMVESPNNTSSSILFQDNSILENDGEITVNHVANVAMQLGSGLFENKTGGIANIRGTTRGFQITTAGRLINNTGAKLNVINPSMVASAVIAFFVQNGKNSSVESINNFGTIISQKMECYNSIINNKACGTIIIKNGQIFNQTSMTFNNDGALILETDNTANNGNFNNNAIFLNKGIFKSKNLPTYTNNGYKVNDNGTNTTIISKGTTLPASISGANVITIYSDTLCASLAGTYSTSTSTFTPTLSAGSYTLYAKLTPTLGTICPYIIPFLYSKVATAPTFPLQPASTNIVCDGTNTFIAVRATDVTSYQWQSAPSGSNTYTNLTETAPYSGVTNDTLFINNATAALSGTKYRCVATGPVAPATNSSICTLTINTISTITSVGTGNKSWNIASSWDLNRVPQKCDIVVINAGVSMSLNVNTTVKSLLNEGILTVGEGIKLNLLE